MSSPSTSMRPPAASKIAEDKVTAVSDKQKSNGRSADPEASGTSHPQPEGRSTAMQWKAKNSHARKGSELAGEPVTDIVSTDSTGAAPEEMSIKSKDLELTVKKGPKE